MRSIFFLASLIIGSSIATNFDFQTKLICDLNNTYTYSVAHWDHDILSFDDHIHDPRSGQANGDVLVFSEGYLGGDEMFSSNYDLYAHINHNCTINGEHKELKIQLGKIHETLSDATLKYEAVLHKYEDINIIKND